MRDVEEACLAGIEAYERLLASHKEARERFKQCSLGVQYGMEADSLGHRIEQTPAHARELLDAHKRTYPQYWRWSAAAVDSAMLYSATETVLGWRQRVGRDANPRSLQNFPVQANGAEMLRLACIFATERGVNVCGPIHDALLIEAPDAEIDNAVATAREAMLDASRVILGGFEVRVAVDDDKIIRWPGRFRDQRGEKMWAIVDDAPALSRGAGAPSRNPRRRGRGRLSSGPARCSHGPPLGCREPPTLARLGRGRAARTWVPGHGPAGSRARRARRNRGASGP